MSRTAALLAWLGGLVVVLGGAAAAVRRAWRTLRAMGRFLDDWFGTDDRPGVIARLDRLEKLAGQLERNGGHSVADQVAQIASTVEAATTPRQQPPRRSW